MNRSAIVYDEKLRPDTTGVYCARALAHLTKMVHWRPAILPTSGTGNYDCIINIDDGLRYRLPLSICPSAWWAIDTHLDLPWYLEKAPDFNQVFTAQRDGCERLRASGIKSVEWLPLACDPEVHARFDFPKQFDFCFVGHMFDGPRADHVKLLQRHFPNHFVGQCFFEAMAETYSVSKIVFNCSIRNDINMRVFEALSCGSLLVTNDLSANGQDELFKDGVHLVTYRDADELLDKVRYYLKHEDVRERIAARGRAEVHAKHTYVHRMRRVLEVMSSLKKTHVAAPAFPQKSETSQASPQRLTSIVIVTCGQLEYTKRCIESIRAHTNSPIELIVVDNGSSDGTPAWLEGQGNVKLIANDENRGFPKAANQGILVSTGDFVLLLNNDVVVTPGWLDKLLHPLAADPSLGLVGPCSNNVSGIQQVPTDYESLDELDTFAERWADSQRGQLVLTDRLVGFCLLVRREVLDRVGLLDERFGVGNFEDDDLCRRAMQQGYRLAVVREAFVHHFGQRTFRGLGLDFKAVMDRNQALYQEKWRSDASVVVEPSASANANKRQHRFRVRVGDRGELWLERTAIQLSLCMIVRDSAQTVRACLESIRPFVDELIVVDTGSEDDTVAIATSCGAKVYHFPWCDSFAVARNESLKYALGEWIFWMDADDTITPENGAKLRTIAGNEHPPEILGFVMQVHCPAPGADGHEELTVVDHVKLFRNRPDLRFEGRIHEQVLPAIRRAGGEVAWTDVHVVHSGVDHSEEAQAKKRSRDLRLLELERQEQPDHPFTLFNLGMTYSEGGDHAQAAKELERSIECSGPEASHVRKAYALLVGSYKELGQLQKAWEVCQSARARFPEDAELLFREGMLAHELGRPGDAVRAYETILQQRENPHFKSIDCGILGYKTRHNLAVVYLALGHPELAELQWQQVVTEVPKHRQGWEGLAEALLRQGKFDAIEEVAGRLESSGRSVHEANLLRARAAIGRGDRGRARAILSRVEVESAEETQILSSVCQILFEAGWREDAEETLRRLVKLVPHDAAARHNLGTVLLQAERFEEALEWFREALQLRPEYSATFDNMAFAFERLGRIDEANSARRAAERRNPAVASG